MKTTSTKATILKSHLTLIKSDFISKITKIDNTTKRIYINTLMPGFNYTNHLGELITPKKCILL
ncbi:hypothetical protein [Lutibacter sp.]|uniref:hypothetical protein n=1 Tax=Lutibacter sp. TaxID=1925666 RepID=UPI001A1E20B2|nr:hypothetical protein [Lutibacter sp.]MBI9041255.1 hypothetical protein [Lutibacter sp.]